MWNVAFGAALAGVMGARFDLVHPFWFCRLLLVATHAVTERQLRQLHIRIFGVRLGWTVAGLARKGFVFGGRKLLQVIFVTFRTGLFSSPERFARSDFTKCIRA